MLNLVLSLCSLCTDGLPGQNIGVCDWSEGSFHCVCSADFARTRPGSISVKDTLTQCITLIALASHFSSMKPSSGLTATGCSRSTPPASITTTRDQRKCLPRRKEKKRRTEVIRVSQTALQHVTLSRLGYLLLSDGIF